MLLMAFQGLFASVWEGQGFAHNGAAHKRKESVQVNHGEQSEGLRPSVWLPLNLQLGLPLEPEGLCQAVCR